VLLALVAWLAASLLLVRRDPAFLVSALFAASFLVVALIDRGRRLVRERRGDRRQPPPRP
jgi:hypothetical protein